VPFGFHIFQKLFLIAFDDEQKGESIDEDTQDDNTHDHLCKHLFVDKSLRQSMDHDHGKTAFNTGKSQYRPPAVVDVLYFSALFRDKAEVKHHRCTDQRSHDKEDYDLFSIHHKFFILDDLCERKEEYCIREQGEKRDDLQVLIQSRLGRDDLLFFGVRSFD